MCKNFQRKLLSQFKPDENQTAIEVYTKVLSPSKPSINIQKTDDQEQLRKQLNILEYELNFTPNDTNLQQKILECKNKLEILNISKTEAAKIRSKIKWVEEGEKCTKYFFKFRKV